MDIQLIHQFPGIISRKLGETPRAWHWQEGVDGLLAIVYVNDVVTYPAVETLSFFLLRVATGEIVKVARSTYSFGHIEELHIAFDPMTQHWVLGDIELQVLSSFYHTVIRVVQDEPDERGFFFGALFDDEGNDLATHGPFFDLHTAGHMCRFLWRKPETDHWNTPQLLHGWVNLVNGEHGLASLAYTESALACRQDEEALLVTFDLQRSLQVEQSQRTSNRWGFLLTGYGPNYQNKLWSRIPALQMPTGKTTILNQVPGNDFEWLGVNAAVIAGPPSLTDGSQTWIVGMTMMDVFRLEGGGIGHSSAQASLLPGQVDALLCIDAMGNTIQTCGNTLGLCIQMVLVGEVVVGVDLRMGRWRIWNWAPQSEAVWHVVITLDPDVMRAHVVTAAEQRRSEQSTCWLIEELPNRVRISQRNAFTLEEVTAPAMLTQVRLLDPQKGSGALDWCTEIDATVYQEKLLLLGVDAADHLVLYQIG